jgi:hypothetical protein
MIHPADPDEASRVDTDLAHEGVVDAEQTWEPPPRTPRTLPPAGGGDPIVDVLGEASVGGPQRGRVEVADDQMRCVIRRDVGEGVGDLAATLGERLADRQVHRVGEVEARDGERSVDLGPRVRLEAGAPPVSSREGDAPDLHLATRRDATTPVIEPRLEFAVWETAGDDVCGIGSELLGGHDIWADLVERSGESIGTGPSVEEVGAHHPQGHGVHLETAAHSITTCWASATCTFLTVQTWSTEYRNGAPGARGAGKS